MRKQLAALPKTDLIQKYIHDEQILNSLQCEQSRKALQINIQLSQREMLLGSFLTAQKIAFRRCEYKLRIRPLKRAFLNWHKNVYDAKIKETDEQVK